jgi:hypothetical protein
MKAHQHRGYDSVIPVTGPEQSGKSTCSEQIKIRLLNVSTVGEYKHILARNTGFKLSEALEEVKALVKYSAYSLDEAIRGMYKRDWYNQDNKELVKIFTQIGMKKGIFLLNIPRFTDLDEFYRNNRARLWIHVIGNEWDMEKEKPTLFHAVLFEKDTHPFNDDPWGLKADRKIIKKASQPIYLLDDIQKKIKLFSKCRSYRDHFTYLPLKQDYWEPYFEMSSRKKMDAEATMVANKYEMAFFKLAAHYRDSNNGDKTALRRLGEIVHPYLSYETIRNKLKDMGSRQNKDT